MIVSSARFRRALTTSPRRVPEVLTLYRTLAVFAPDQTVPKVVVAMLWEHLAKCSDHDVEITLTLLHDRSLLVYSEQSGSSRRFVGIHDLHHDYLRHSQPGWQYLHKVLLDAYRERCPIELGWAGGPVDGYFFQHLVYHLRAADCIDELRHCFSTGIGSKRS